jgi:acetolactate synthase regulatory subunit
MSSSASAARSPRPDASNETTNRDSTFSETGRLQASGAACFSVHARAEPGLMPRVLELFAKRGLVPSSWHSATGGPVVDGQQSELTIDIQMRGLAPETADFIAARLRQIPDVELVLTSQKR